MKKNSVFIFPILISLGLSFYACESSNEETYLETVLASEEFDTFFASYQKFMSDDVLEPQSNVRIFENYDEEAFEALKNKTEFQMSTLQADLESGKVTREEVNENEGAYFDDEVSTVREQMKAKHAKMYEAKATVEKSSIALKKKFPKLNSDDLFTLIEMRTSSNNLKK